MISVRMAVSGKGYYQSYYIKVTDNGYHEGCYTCCYRLIRIVSDRGYYEGYCTGYCRVADKRYCKGYGEGSTIGFLV